MVSWIGPNWSTSNSSVAIRQIRYTIMPTLSAKGIENRLKKTIFLSWRRFLGPPPHVRLVNSPFNTLFFSSLFSQPFLLDSCRSKTYWFNKPRTDIDFVFSVFSLLPHCPGISFLSIHFSLQFSPYIFFLFPYDWSLLLIGDWCALSLRLAIDPTRPLIIILYITAAWGMVCPLIYYYLSIYN